jgi:hypothetical protein
LSRLLKDASDASLPLSAPLGKGEKNEHLAVEQGVGRILKGMNVANQADDTDSTVVLGVQLPVIAKQHVTDHRLDRHTHFLKTIDPYRQLYRARPDMPTLPKVEVEQPGSLEALVAWLRCNIVIRYAGKVASGHRETASEFQPSVSSRKICSN